jgi:hypothetical protein
MPSSRDSFRRNRVAPVGAFILAFPGTVCWRGGEVANGLKTNAFVRRLFILLFHRVTLYAQERFARMSVDTPADRFHNRK